MLRWCLISLLALLAWPAHAKATSPIFAWPFGQQKPMCVGVEVAPVWGEHGNYTGRCRYGAPLGPMVVAIRTMDRRLAVGTAEEDGLSSGFGDKLSTELSNIYGLPVLRARARLKRDAKKGRRSWTSRAAVNCALYGGVLAGLPTLYELAVKHRIDVNDAAEAGAIGCAGAVLTPRLNRWIKSHGFDLED